VHGLTNRPKEMGPFVVYTAVKDLAVTAEDIPIAQLLSRREKVSDVPAIRRVRIQRDSEDSVGRLNS
jgi:hypothetical protein